MWRNEDVKVMGKPARIHLMALAAFGATLAFAGLFS